MTRNALLTVFIVGCLTVPQLCAEDPLKNVTDLNRAGLQAHQQRDFDTAGAKFEQALEVVGYGQSGHEREAISLLRNLFVVRRDQYRLPEAEQQSRKALQLAEKTFGPSHRTVRNIQSDLGEVLWMQGKSYEAISYFQRALGATKGASDASEDDLVRASANLAVALRAVGQQSKAIDLLKPIVADCRLRGAKTYNSGVAINNLAMAMADLGEFQPAKELQTEAVEAFNAIDAQLAKASALMNLAQIKILAGEHDEVETILDSSLKLLTANGEDNRPAAVQTLSLLGAHYFRAGQTERAEPLLGKAAQISQTYFYAGHPDTVATLKLYSQVLKKLGRKKEAKQIAKQARAQEEQGNSAEHKVAQNVVDVKALLNESAKR
ncbi:MAG TPA: tetratricopeptide repeat protein [Bryobacteraceae bacterium]|nr:tetratricopeptide repeat protein [Bryobacteraceae bacterium]